MADFTIDFNKIRKLRDGQYSADLKGLKGVTGQPIAGGIVVTEHNPNLHPVTARGYNGTPGRYSKTAKHPAAQAVLQRRKKALASAGWRTQRCPLPPAMRENRRAMLIRERQYEFCSHLLWRWQNNPLRMTLPQFIREVSMTLPTEGFYLGELRAESGLFTFSDGAQTIVYYLDLPYFRAQSSVHSWLFDGDVNIGVVLMGGSRSQIDGDFEGTSSVLSAAEYIVISRDRVGIQYEGNSELRAVDKNVELSWALQEVESKSIEIRGFGELFFKKDGNRVEALSPQEQAALKDYIRYRLEGKRVGGQDLPPGVTPELLSPSTSMPEVTGPLSRHSKAIYDAMGAEDRYMATEGGGSYAARATAAQHGLEEHSDDANQFVIEPLRELFARAIRWSGLDEGEEDMLFVPEITAAPLHDNVSPLELAQAVAMLLNAGAITQWTMDHENSLRARLGLPAADMVEDSTRRPGGESPGGREDLGDDGGVRQEADRPVPTDDE